MTTVADMLKKPLIFESVGGVWFAHEIQLDMRTLMLRFRGLAGHLQDTHRIPVMIFKSTDDLVNFRASIIDLPVICQYIDDVRATQHQGLVLTMEEILSQLEYSHSLSQDISIEILGLRDPLQQWDRISELDLGFGPKAGRPIPTVFHRYLSLVNCNNPNQCQRDLHRSWVLAELAFMSEHRELFDPAAFKAAEHRRVQIEYSADGDPLIAGVAPETTMLLVMATNQPEETVLEIHSMSEVESFYAPASEYGIPLHSGDHLVIELVEPEFVRDCGSNPVLPSIRLLPLDVVSAVSAVN